MAKLKTDKKNGDCLGTGRRKTAVVRVRMRPGTGKILVNDRPFEEYFLTDAERRFVKETLSDAGLTDKVDLKIRASGGGTMAQAQACVMGLGRAMLAFNGELETLVREKSFLTRDSRMKERKHYGLRGARRGTQFSKR
jgi:small subunit ribosomal protein S9